MSKELALSASDIQDLRDEGFIVESAADTGQAGYVWRNLRSGASQMRDTPQQPPRRTEAQAWYDSDRYRKLSVSATAEPDWEDEQGGSTAVNRF